MKDVLSSLTIIGALVALFSKFLGVEITEAEANDILARVQTLWPLLLGILADLYAAWQRIKTTRFDVRWWSSKVFWAGLFSAAMTVAAAVGIDVESLQPVIEKSLSTWPAIAALLGSVLVIVGRFRASRRIVGSASQVH